MDVCRSNINIFSRVYSFFLLGALTTGSLVPVEGSAADLTVTNSPELQAALTTAQGNGEADTITIAGGTYKTSDNNSRPSRPFTYSAEPGENFALTMLGAGAKTTFLDGGGGTRVLTIDTFSNLENDDAAHIIIANLMIGNGKTDEVTGGFGGGLFVNTGSAAVTIENSTFSNNSATFPGAAAGGGAEIDTLSGSVAVTRSTFLGNTVSSKSGSAFGGGIDVVTESGGITLTANAFEGNSAEIKFLALFEEAAGGGANVESYSGDIILINNVIRENSVISPHSNIGSGGGVSIVGSGDAEHSGNVKVENNLFARNRIILPNFGSAFGGGAFVKTFGRATMTLINNRFIENSNGNAEVSRGSGAYVNAELADIYLTNNTATLNEGASTIVEGVYVSTGEDTAKLNIYNNIIWANNSNNLRSGDMFVADDTNRDGIGSIVNFFNNDFSRSQFQCEKPSCSSNGSEGSNIQKDPLLLDPRNLDVHLHASSPARGKGSRSAPFLPDADFEGDPRIVGSGPDIGADEFVPVINDRFAKPTISKQSPSDDFSDCPSGFMAKFSFTARFSNISNNSLSSLVAHVTQLTKPNLLQNADGGPGGVEARLTVKREGSFADGLLSPREFVDVPFVICLGAKEKFTFLVDILGVVR